MAIAPGINLEDWGIDWSKPRAKLTLSLDDFRHPIKSRILSRYLGEGKVLTVRIDGKNCELRMSPRQPEPHTPDCR